MNHNRVIKMYKSGYGHSQIARRLMLSTDEVEQILLDWHPPHRAMRERERRKRIMIAYHAPNVVFVRGRIRDY